MNSSAISRYYDAYYFARGCGEPYQRNDVWLAQFNALAERIVHDIQPATVLDAGCALGMMVEALRNRDVEAWGIDVSEFAIQHAHPDVQPYCRVGSVTEPFSKKYELIVCIEVLEHLPPRDGEKAVTNICEHTDNILFSSTPFDYKEITHFNVQPPEYWAELFARSGYFRDVDYDASYITPWAARFRRTSEPLHRIVRGYERKFWLLWQENTSLRELNLDMRDQLAANEQKIKKHEGQLQSLQAQFEGKEREIQNINEKMEKIMNSQGWRLLQWLQRLRGRGIEQET